MSALAVAGALLHLSCSPRPATPPLHELAEQYVRLTLQVAQHRPSLVDSWTGPADWRPGPRVPVTELRSAVDALLARAEGLHADRVDQTDAPRVLYLQGQLRALALVTRRLLGESTRFADEAYADFGRALPRADQSALNRARIALEAELEGGGPLAARYAAFRRRFRVGADDTSAVFRAAIEACRAATAAHLVLPPDEHLVLSFDDAMEWAAFARYRGSHETELTIGSLRDYDIASLLHLACHETYAGHHAQHVLIDDALVKGRGWLEFHLTPAFGPHRLISEGAAEAGVELALPETERARVYRERLMPLAGLSPREAARLARVETLAASLEAMVPPVIAKYLDNEASSEATHQQLAADALLVSPQRVLALAERQRTAAVVYPVGRAVVSDWVGRATTQEERWRKLQDLFTRTPFALN